MEGLENLEKKLKKNIARTVCRLTGSIKPYRRIMNISFRVGRSSIHTKGDNVNCHGFMFYALGIDHSVHPRYVPAEVMEEFLESCFKSRKENGFLFVLREGRGDLAHSALYVSPFDDPLLIQKEEIGQDYSIQSYRQFLAGEGLLKTELFEEYYKIIPDRLRIPSYFLSS